MLGLSTKNNEYLKIRDDYAGAVLHAMKLLAKANIMAHTESYLRTVCAEIFGEKELLTDEKKWREAVNQLVQMQFVTEETDKHNREVSLVIRKDTYFDLVITDYPWPNRPQQMQRDLARLGDILVRLEYSKTFVDLGLTSTNFKLVD